MDQTLYDEFGNYIGPDVDDESEEDNGSLAEEDALLDELDTDVSASVSVQEEDVVLERAVVPHEEKKYYPEAEELYPGVETLVEDEDTQPLTEPIIASVKTKNFDMLEKEIPSVTFSYEYVTDLLMYKPELTRQICLLGHFHSGKTLFMDIFVQQTHPNIMADQWSNTKRNKYSDTRQDEIARGLSVKAVPMTLVLPDSNDKSYLFHIFDTPGHLNFQDECTAAIRLSDGGILVVDALMGVMANTERLLKHALQEKLSVMIVLNSIDRLIMELRLPPNDAFHKLRHTIEEINTIASSYCASLGLPQTRFSPSLGNVAFASALYGCVFTLESFASMYVENYKMSPTSKEGMKGGWMRGLSGDIDVQKFAKCLWGDIYRHPTTGAFVRRPPDGETPRTFVQYVLEPIYKIFAHTAGEEQPTLEPLLQEIGVYLKKDDFRLDTRALLRKVCQAYFGDARAFVDMVVKHCPNPKEGAVRKVRHTYTGNMGGPVAVGMMACDPNSDTLMIHTTKNYHRPNCDSFDVLGRVMSGTVWKGQKVKVLGETFSLDDDEDMCVKEITHLWIYQSGRYRVEVPCVPAGNWVLIGGIDKGVTKTATLMNSDIVTQDARTGKAKLVKNNVEEVEIFRPLRFATRSVIKVSCEPLNPSELPKMLEGFRKISKAYPICQTKVEESGEHILIGTGELYLDCVLHDLRKLYGDLEIKVSDPVVQFSETVVETSALKCFAETPNKKNKLFMISEPLEKGISEDIEAGVVKCINPSQSYISASNILFKDPLEDREEDVWNEKRLGEFFTSKYDWDLLAARSIWAFGPDHQGPNVLLDDTLPSDVDKELLGAVKPLIIQGFQWVTREGPLIEEPVRNCKFRILDASFSKDQVNRGGGQIIPTARRVAYSSFLLATPRLMEPMLFTEIECPADCVSAVYTVLSRRRGHVAKDLPKPGTPLYSVHAFLPAIESFGFETDLRTHTSGQAFCLSIFDHWALVPGDPLDKSIVLRPLEPAPAPHLAREFLLKTRRRKGLSENVLIHKFFDNPMLVELARQDADLNQYF